MTTETLLAISAGATFLLALAAFWAIWQNYELHKRERKERLLNEIIEWAKSILKCQFESQRTTLPAVELARLNYEDKMQVCDIVNLAGRVHLFLGYDAVDASSEYIKTIAAEFKSKNLNDLVKETTDTLKELLEFLKQVTARKIGDEGFGTYRNQLSKSAVALLQEAAKIKTRDIDRVIPGNSR